MFEIKVDREIALQEIDNFLLKRKVYPRQQTILKDNYGDLMADVISYGQVIFNEDGSVTQNLISPIEAIGLNTIKFKARVTPEEMQRALAAVRNPTLLTQSLVYTKMHTGLTEAELNKLEKEDRMITDMISLFFQS